MLHSRKFILPIIGVFLLFGFCFDAWLSHASAQVTPLTYPQIITALNTAIPNDAFKTKAQLITFLIGDIRRRKVDKPLTDDREADLRQAGATNELIEVIRANSPSSRPTPSPTPVSTRTPRPTPTPTPSTLPKQIRNAIGMEFVLIPPGSFIMGSPESEKDRKADEGPQHRVNINYGFYMGKYEVTQGQWKAVIGRAHPGMNGLDPEFVGDDLPVVRISWNDAKMFVETLNSQDRTYMYRLPSEAEWEYTARAGTKTRFYWGDDPKFSALCKYANVKDYSDCPDGYKRTAPVRSYAPNAFGLYNMTGNVWEWCIDIWQDNYQNTPTDGAPNVTAGAKRVQRGGSWADDPRNVRSAVRGGDLPTDRNDEDGFRLVAAPRAILAQ
jgi:formylglycine-generating enzyme required for sulfatase activity